ncbi:MAG: 2-oxoacid:acceptor oxidoreductase subunit alpha [Deltaproteobacteria bacterium]|nr:2-oxoacid:acceptor oxidoreductase subunit alpha [Deltaproteobacteria bacterium]MBN2674094.1 2-oxoacid:acceptor oxidoreductase subunit alpha [Deltaproteobacteria bacterium]
MTDISIRLAGAAGQGLQSAGKLLGKACVRAGYHVFAVQDSMSRIRGGHNFFQFRICDTPVWAMKKQVDLLVTLDREGVESDISELKFDGIAILDNATLKADIQDSRVIDVPLRQIAMDTGKKPIFSTSAAMGFTFSVLGLDIELLTKQFTERFKDEAVAKANSDAAREGFAKAVEHAGKVGPLPTIANAPKRLFLNGNEAAALGAISANMKFISCYPMSPSTGIITYIAGKEAECGIITEQAEDEIAAANQAVGASMAGVRAMTASSGGGMALMSETISLCGVAEVPLVIVNCQRGGPGTGLPTRTEQSDLLFSTFTGHGDFPRAVLAPTNAEEAFYLTAKAFNIADRYQIPVIVLSDQHIADSFFTVDPYNLDKVPTETSVVSTKTLEQMAEYKRYAITDSGISPRSYPGQSKHLMLTDSHEHYETGHIADDPVTRNAMVEKRGRKTAKLSASYTVQQNGSAEAETAVISWGSTGDTLKEAVSLLKNKGVHLNHVHLTEVWPFPTRQFEQAVEKSSRLIAVEGNATGQLAAIATQHTGKKFELLPKYDGRPFIVEDLVDALQEVVK